MEYEAKNKAQHGLILNLMETIHSLKASPSDDSKSSGSEKDSKTIAKMCHLLTKNAQRAADLSEEVERMKSRLRKYVQESADARQKNDEDSDESEHYEDDAEFVDVSLCDNEDDYISCLSGSSSFSSSQTSTSRQQTIRFEEEIVRISSKCTSLERSLSTLKRKNAERELRSMKSLRNMRQQIESLEQERKRRLVLQTNAEERALELEIQILELKEENRRQDVFRRQQPQQDKLESPVHSSRREKKRDDFDPLTKKAIDSCREVIMMRNQLDKVSYPPILLVVSEESENSEKSEDDFRPCMDGGITSE